MMLLPEGTPEFSTDDPDWMKKLEVAMTDRSIVTRRNRPYVGQAHTCTGDSGKQEVSGITLRDIYDCVLISIVKATAAFEPDFEQHIIDHTGKDGKCDLPECNRPMCLLDRGELQVNDVYRCRLAEADPVAIMQCVVTEVKGRMADE